MILVIFIWVTFFTAIDLYTSQTNASRPKDKRTPGTRILQPIERKQRTHTIETQTDESTSMPRNGSAVMPSATTQETMIQDLSDDDTKPRRKVRFNDNVEALENAAKEGISTTSSETDIQSTVADPVSTKATTAPVSFDFQTVARALELTQKVYSQNKSKLSSTVEKITTPHVAKIIYISELVTNYQKVYNIYKLLKTNHVDFINTVNKTFQTSFTFSTKDIDVLAYFINKIFESIVESSINDNLFSRLQGKQLEFYLQSALEKMVVQNGQIAQLLYNILIDIAAKLNELKIAFKDQKTDLTLSYFNSELPIETWIELTKKLADTIQLIIPKTEEAKISQEISLVFPEEKELRTKIENEAAQDLESLVQQAKLDAKAILKREEIEKQKQRKNRLESISNEIKTNFEKMAKDDYAVKEKEFEESKKLALNNKLEELKKIVTDRFKILEEKENKTTLEAELRNINNILNAVKKLVTDKKDQPNFKEIFTFLLNAVYKELISDETVIYRHDLVGKVLDSDAPSYILKKKFNNKDVYTQLYEIIFYKLNTLILAYALNIEDSLLDTKLPINIIFQKNNTFEKYSFIPSLKILLLLNENAQCDDDGQQHLKNKVNPIKYREMLAQAGTAALGLFYNIFESLGSIIPNPQRWFSSWFEESRKRKQEEQEKLRKEIQQNNDVLKKILDSLNNPQTQPQEQNPAPAAPVSTPTPAPNATATSATPASESAPTPSPAAPTSAAQQIPKSAALRSVVPVLDERTFKPEDIDMEDINKITGSKKQAKVIPATAAPTSTFNWGRALFGNPREDENQ